MGTLGSARFSMLVEGVELAFSASPVVQLSLSRQERLCLKASPAKRLRHTETQWSRWSVEEEEEEDRLVLDKPF